MSKRHREDWKSIRNLSWSGDQELIETLDVAMEDAYEDDLRLPPERPAGRRGRRDRFDD